MAYAAVLSLLQTLEQLHQPHQLIKIHPNSEIQFLHQKLCLLKKFLEHNVRVENSSEFEREIRDATHEAENFIKIQISELFLSSSLKEETYSSLTPLQSVQKIDSITTRAMEFMADLQVNRDLDDPDNPVPTRNDFDHGNLLVGRGEDIDRLMDRLISGSSRLDIIPIVGVSGIGKTALAEKLYTDLRIMDYFETRVWIRISYKYRKRDVLIGLLHSMKKISDKKSPNTDDQLAKILYQSLKPKRYLIVFDNVCDTKALNDLKPSFPDNNYGSRIMLTTKNMDLGDIGIGPRHELTFLSLYESWYLLDNIVDMHSPECFEIGMEIAKNCRGLPLAIVILGGLLSRLSMIDWTIIASSIQTCENYVELIKVVVFLSYKYLPHHLKACLLYMGVFPHEYEISVSTLANLWIAEGFLEAKLAEEYILQLVSRSLVSVCERSYNYKIKTCRINDVFLSFVMEKAKEEKFFHIIDDENTNGFLEDHRCLSIHEDLHFGIKFMSKYNTKASISTTQSLLYFGPDPEYPLRGWLSFKLVKVLNALKIRFYSFPSEILELVHLTYLALSYNGEIPASLCKLRNLQVLIILQYLIIKRVGAPLYLPMEIWNMATLRHLQVMGSDLPDPSTATLAGGKNDSNLLLENLSTLYVSNHSCTPGVFERIPRLKKLRIQIETIMSTTNLSFLIHLFILQQLESLKCTVMHPCFGSRGVTPPFRCIFPCTLRKLTMSGCGLPWEFMSVIEYLPNLEVLKLQHYACKGPVWDMMIERVNSWLRYILLEDMDIEYWRADALSFPFLRNLVIRNCYKLKGIPIEFGRITTLQQIELVDCSPSATVFSARRIKEEHARYGNIGLAVQVYYSWDHVFEVQVHQPQM